MAVNETISTTSFEDKSTSMLITQAHITSLQSAITKLQGYAANVDNCGNCTTSTTTQTYDGCNSCLTGTTYQNCNNVECSGECRECDCDCYNRCNCSDGCGGEGDGGCGD